MWYVCAVCVVLRGQVAWVGCVCGMLSRERYGRKVETEREWRRAGVGRQRVELRHKPRGTGVRCVPRFGRLSSRSSRGHTTASATVGRTLRGPLPSVCLFPVTAHQRTITHQHEQEMCCCCFAHAVTTFARCFAVIFAKRSCSVGCQHEHYAFLLLSQLLLGKSVGTEGH